MTLDVPAETWAFRRQSDGAILLLLLIAIVAVYAQTARFDFVNYDDTGYVVENPILTTGIQTRSIEWAFTTFRQSNWHPLTWVSYLADSQFLSLRPGLMHLENALIHALNSCLVYLLLATMTSRRGPSAWAAAIFGLHPLHVESVAWISERKDLLCSFFVLLCLCAYVHYVRTSRKNWLVATGVLLAMALLAKPMAVTAPALMLLLDIWPLQRARGNIKKIIVEKIPFFFLVAMSSFITMQAQAAGRSVVGIQEIPFSMRLANAFVSYGTYLRMLVAPYGLAVFYPHPGLITGAAVDAKLVLLSAATIILITSLAIGYIRSMPWLMIGWLWFLGTLVPVIGLVQVGDQAMADRYAYLPSIGIFICVACSIRECTSTRLAAAAIVLFFTALCWRQIGCWRNTETLMRRAIAVVPNNYVAHGILGQWLEEQGDSQGAQREYEQSLAIQSSNLFSLQGMMRLNASAGRMDEAVRYAQLAIAAQPQVPLAYHNYAALLVAMGKSDEAIAVLDQAIQVNPPDSFAAHNTAVLLANRGDLAHAIEYWKKAVNAAPKYVDALSGLGQAQIASGQIVEGIEHLQLAAREAENQGNHDLSLRILAFIEQHRRGSATIPAR